jgi:hypothetical protein
VADDPPARRGRRHRAEIGCHTFRATGITAYLANGGALEHAQEMAVHGSPRTTKLYDGTKERLTQDEVERIGCDWDSVEETGGGQSRRHHDYAHRCT